MGRHRVLIYSREVGVKANETAQGNKLMKCREQTGHQKVKDSRAFGSRGN